MKLRFLPVILLCLATQLWPTKVLQAQTKEELEELKNSAPLGAEGKGSKKGKITTTANGEKVRELPEPTANKFGKNKRLAKQLFGQGSIYNGLKYYEAALSQKPKKTELNQPLADGNFLLRDFATANKYYKTLVELDAEKHKNLFALYQYALTDKYLGNYQQAKENFSKFNQLTKDKDEFAQQRTSATREAQGCDMALTLANSTDLRTYKTALLNANINQPLTDFSPFLKDANTLYYGSWVSDKMELVNKHEKAATFSRIYMATKRGGVWAKGEEAKVELNTVQAHTGNAAFSYDGNTMYYTQCLQNEVQAMRCDIYRSTHSANGWSKGEALTAVNSAGVTTTHPSVGKNEAGEDVLYFASDRNPGKGMDIFYAKINADGTLDKPKTAGGSINTTGDEITPFYDFKNNVLFFSSNGHINIGGLDVFKTTYKDGDWTAPENLGLPVNSSLDDMYFMWNAPAALGFVVSNRTGGFSLKSPTCCDDIYQVELNKLYLAVKGNQTVADSANTPIRNGMITLYEQETGKEIASVYAVDGSYLFDLEGEKNYKLVSRKKDFEEIAETLSTIGARTSDTTIINFAMKPIPASKIKVGDRIGVVYWEFNKDNLTQTAPDTLNAVVEFMNANGSYVLEVGSHTDNKGSDDYNMKLSKRRSDAVLKYLLSKKVPDYRLESKAYGESQPAELNENPAGVDNPDGRTKNRRTEFKLIRELTPEQLAEEQVKSEKKALKKARAIQGK